jgi:acyl-CoA reductase-like NAD-dependent aldehyde dehydrogenase
VILKKMLDTADVSGAGGDIECMLQDIEMPVVGAVAQPKLPTVETTENNAVDMAVIEEQPRRQQPSDFNSMSRSERKELLKRLYDENLQKQLELAMLVCSVK